ncbi:hypothetical protein GCM10022285_54940 [Streptomyces tunisiensis]|uniref:Uncharacterized protein n=1 Tax=Streptomyces tunisiensis TaxID=948699 RepID=A0ABP7Z556_9ACTN
MHTGPDLAEDVVLILSVEEERGRRCPGGPAEYARGAVGEKADAPAHVGFVQAAVARGDVLFGPCAVRAGPDGAVAATTARPGSQSPVVVVRGSCSCAQLPSKP